ncbi:ADP-ribosylation factor-binding protein GGA1-like isoform X2 [Zophobas morio]|uniref:ADP-ribosylation factor-binding protein GGA1-like isoform X2 n=1 Tax=Zophobas morio TaxID=2755281 RepID=UPI0030833FA7
MTDITQLRELIDRATNPLLEQINWQYVIDVCDAVKSFDEGPHIVTSFVIEHLRGSEKVALHALTLLDACVENCGPHFYRVIGKFKFLNELTQLVSKKHGYVNTPEKVRDRILFLMSKWRVNLQLPKILEVCATLERQGYPLTSLSRDATSFDKNFLQWKYKSSLSPKSESEHILPRLLQSKDPADLTTANLLIKEIFETEYTEEKNKEKLKDDLNIVRENIRIFVEVLEASKDTLEHKEVLEEICEALLGVKPRLANLCRELERDEDIEFVLNIYSKLIDALELYDQFVRLGKKPRSNVLIDFGDQGLEEAATIPSELFSVVILDRNGVDFYNDILRNY